MTPERQHTIEFLVDMAIKLIPLIVFGVLAWYFSQNNQAIADHTKEISSHEARLSVLEAQHQQLSAALLRFEEKLDRALAKR